MQDSHTPFKVTLFKRWNVVRFYGCDEASLYVDDALDVRIEMLKPNKGYFFLCDILKDEWKNPLRVRIQDHAIYLPQGKMYYFKGSWVNQPCQPFDENSITHTYCSIMRNIRLKSPPHDLFPERGPPRILYDENGDAICYNLRPWDLFVPKFQGIQGHPMLVHNGTTYVGKEVDRFIVGRAPTPSSGPDPEV